MWRSGSLLRRTGHALAARLAPLEVSRVREVSELRSGLLTTLGCGDGEKETALASNPSLLPSFATGLVETYLMPAIQHYIHTQALGEIRHNPASRVKTAATHA
jgi:hypothetical protein